ncbi:hypothetical protein D3C85_1899300 [compost metagenome]
MAGKANKIIAEVMNAVHVNIGIRMKVIPGARIVMTVARKLMPPIRVPRPAI